MKLVPFTCAAALLAASATPTHLLAQVPLPSPAGDWEGTMVGSGGPVRVAVHIERSSSGALSGDIDLPSGRVWDAPLEQVTVRDGVLTFSFRGGARRYEGRWDAEAGAWTGKFQTPGGSTDLVLKPGFLGLPVASQLDGRWDGVFDAGAPIRVILRVETDEHGTHGVLDLPHALEVGIPVDLTVASGAVSFTAPAAGLRFEGMLDAKAETMKGVFGPPGANLPLVLAHRGREAGLNRPQHPAPPLPYRVEEISISNPADAKVKLACSLTTPDTVGPHPAALLLSGTGPQDRDESIVGHRPFLVLADYLSRRGLAVLRCDDRGAGASFGEFNAATLEDFASDAVAAVQFLRARPDIASGRVGLVGHSEGGLVASMVAAADPGAAFVVLMAGPGVAIHELLLRQGEETSRAQGVPEATIAQQSAVRREVFAAVRSAPSPQAARAAVEALLTAKGSPPGTSQSEAALVTRPDIMRILNVDPATSLAGISAPVLALIGAKDTQVPAAQNLPALRLALARNADATILELPSLNHLLQTAKTGGVAEYYEIEETMAPLALETIADWLAQRGFGSPR